MLDADKDLRFQKKCAGAGPYFGIEKDWGDSRAGSPSDASWVGPTEARGAAA